MLSGFPGSLGMSRQQPQPGSAALRMKDIISFVLLLLPPYVAKATCAAAHGETSELSGKYEFNEVLRRSISP
jgi:hypothetical protein